MKLNAKELRELSEAEIEAKLRSIKRNPIYFILENVYDTYNIGGLFRLADALAIEKMYLCGDMETPPNHRIKKASIGTDKIVPWEYKQTVKEVVESLRIKPITILAIEQHPKANLYTDAVYKFPVAFVLGNETAGIEEKTLKLCDQIVEIPMWGVNKSLNVIVSAAIVSYHAISQI